MATHNQEWQVVRVVDVTNLPKGNEFELLTYKQSSQARLEKFL